MWRDKGAAPVDYYFAVGFESVCGVIQLDAEKKAQEIVGDPIDEQLNPRIIDDTAALYKTTAKNAVVTLVQLLPIKNHITAIIRFICHHDNNRIPFHHIKTAAYR